MHVFIHQIKDADFRPYTRGNTSDANNGCQMMSYSHVEKYLNRTLPEKCPYSELFWSVFSRIRTEYGPPLIPNTYSFYAVGVSI